MAEFTCKKCQYQVSVPDRHLGKRTKCPKCKEPGAVDGPSALVVVDPIPSETEEAFVVLRQSGGSIKTPLSRTIILNKESSLEREFITVVDQTLPARLINCVGITTIYEQSTDFSPAKYVYSSSHAVRAIEEIRAFETRFLIFNIWGRHVRTLSTSEIADVASGKVRHCDSSWEVYSENEVAEHYASICFLAMVRTTSGLVFDADLEPVMIEARRFSTKFSANDLEPTRPTD